MSSFSPKAPAPLRRRSTGAAPARRRVSAAAELERILAAAMTARDPVAVVQAAAADPGLPTRLRQALSTVQADGLRMTALLSARLRFERLLRGSEPAEWLFERDAAAFSELFRRYHETVPPTAFFPPDEARLFAAFLTQESQPSPPSPPDPAPPTAAAAPTRRPLPGRTPPRARRAR